MIRHFYLALYHLGGFGLLILGALDSSLFFFLPFGNDLLLVALTARHYNLVFFYAFMATLGSLIGCLFTDVISRKGGEEGLKGRVPHRQLAYVKRKVKKNAGWALAFASVVPPPFPFTAFVVAAAALQFPRRKLLTWIAGGRFVRFYIEGLLAVAFGRRILRWARTPEFEAAIVALMVVCFVGTAVTLYTWIRRSRKTSAIIPA